MTTNQMLHEVSYYGFGVYRIPDGIVIAGPPR